MCILGDRRFFWTCTTLPATSSPSPHTHSTHAYTQGKREMKRTSKGEREDTPLHHRVGAEREMVGCYYRALSSPLVVPSFSPPTTSYQLLYLMLSLYIFPITLCVSSMDLTAPDDNSVMVSGRVPGIHRSARLVKFPTFLFTGSRGK